MATATAIPLTTGAVAELLGVSPVAVRKMDHALAPTRNEHGFRVYDPARVSTAIAERAKRVSRNAR